MYVACPKLYLEPLWIKFSRSHERIGWYWEREGQKESSSILIDLPQGDVFGEREGKS